MNAEEQRLSDQAKQTWAETVRRSLGICCEHLLQIIYHVLLSTNAFPAKAKPYA